MNLQLLSRVLCQPWAMRPLELSALTQLIISQPSAGVVPWQGPAVISSTPAASGTRATEKPKTIKAASGAASVNATTATVIPIWGVLGRCWEDYEIYWLNAVDVDDLMAEIDATPAGSPIVLWFRSPGGIVTGIPEMAAYLRSAVKSRTIIAFTDDICASAAYWLASQCSCIVSTPTADVGSIGVYIAFYDWTEFLTKQGISLELFKAGRLKAMGMMGNPLSDEEVDYLQTRVDGTYSQFTADVLRNRDIATDTMQGQTFQGKDALATNLVDMQLPSFSAFTTALATGRLPV